METPVHAHLHSLTRTHSSSAVFRQGLKLTHLWCLMKGVCTVKYYYLFIYFFGEAFDLCVLFDL